MADQFDQASDLECAERDHALRAHLSRPVRPVPLCEECGDQRCHVTALNVVWRFCADCAESLLRGQ